MFQLLEVRNKFRIKCRKIKLLLMQMYLLYRILTKWMIIISEFYLYIKTKKTKQKKDFFFLKIFFINKILKN